MKIGVLSDSHDNMPKISAAVSLFNEEGVGLVVHAGDFISPITAREFSNLDVPMIGVFGNNDGDRLYLRERFAGIGEIYPDYHEFSVEGVRGVVMHEPKFIEALVSSGSYDLVIYGHTHEVDLRGKKPLVLNPGECGGWLSGSSTVAIVDSARMIARIVEL